MSNKWIQALKDFNKDKGCWCVPKKNTEQYKQVLTIKNSNDTEKQASKYLGNIVKSRLEENKYLTKIVDKERRAVGRKKVNTILKKPEDTNLTFLENIYKGRKERSKNKNK